MKLTERQNELFAILFAAGEPLELGKLAETLELTSSETQAALEGLSAMLETDRMPLELCRLQDSYQLCTASAYAPVIRRALEIKRNVPLSSAALETLAVIAYNQPVTRSFVEQVRGVDSSGVVTSLAEKGLVEEAGRLDLPGKPIAYRTTESFLRCFSLSGLGDLPSVEAPDDPAVEDDEEQISFEEMSKPTEDAT